MKEIKLTIDGKEVQLTDEQLKTLGIEVRKNPFERVGKYEGYYCIKETGEIYTYYDDRGSLIISYMLNQIISMMNSSLIK